MDYEGQDDVYGGELPFPEETNMESDFDFSADAETAAAANDAKTRVYTCFFFFFLEQGICLFLFVGVKIF